jgi:hypothetical protein
MISSWRHVFKYSGQPRRSLSNTDDDLIYVLILHHHNLFPILWRVKECTKLLILVYLLCHCWGNPYLWAHYLWSTTFRCSTDKYPWRTTYRCSTDMILPMAYREGDAPWISGLHRAPGPGVSGPHIRGACIWGAPRIICIPVAHHIYMRHGYVWAHPLKKVADISVEHHFEVRYGYIYLWSTILRCATDMPYLPP